MPIEACTLLFNGHKYAQVFVGDSPPPQNHLAFIDQSMGHVLLSLEFSVEFAVSEEDSPSLHVWELAWVNL